MKLYELFIRNLDEVNMSPSSLQSWADEHARGMESGFEAEMIFTGALDPEKYKKTEPEFDDEEEDDGSVLPDYDNYDEEVDTIDEIISFFSSMLTEQQAARLHDKLREDYYRYAVYMAREEFDSRDRSIVQDYIVNNGDWDEKEEMIAYMRDALGLSKDEIIKNMNRISRDSYSDIYYDAEEYATERLEERIQNALVEHTDDYDNAYAEFESDYVDHTASEKDWLRSSQNVRWMSDAEIRYDLTWPHMSDGSTRNMTRQERDNRESYEYFPEPNGRYDVNIARLLAKSLEETLGVKTKVHLMVRTYSEKKNTPKDVWVFEPDGSVRGNNFDLPIEIVSPPMRLDQTLKIMPKFFDWAKSKGGRNNSTTGLHMSVSITGREHSRIDYTKTALFLGDKHVLDLFGRAANSYCESAIDRMTLNRNNMNAENLKGALEKMRHGLSDLAGLALADASGFGKFITINPKGKYIEFRSAGGVDYMNDVPKIQNTMLRYARATTLGMNLDEEKQEYAKKLFKFLSNVKLERNSIVGHTPEGPIKKPGGKVSVVPQGRDEYSKDVIWLFSQYVAGELPKNALKSFLKTKHSIRKAKDFMDDKAPVIEDENNEFSHSGYWVVYAYDKNRPNNQDSVEGLIRAGSPEDAITAYHIWIISDSLMEDAKYGIRPASRYDIENYRNAVLDNDDDDEPFNIDPDPDHDEPSIDPIYGPILTNVPEDSDTGYWALTQVNQDQIMGIYSSPWHNRPNSSSAGWQGFNRWATEHAGLGAIYVRVRTATQAEIHRAIAAGIITPEQNTGDNSPRGNTFTGRWFIRDADTDQILHTFENPLNMSNRANMLAQHWLERYGPEGADMTQITVTPDYQ